ncbi:MAG: hypothetical protein KKF16_05260 [Euryarchaeota archaeon]|nr:hypothetical protein [Euryarchaeota archaeon]MBV1729169.1 hypothetical protein [Methanobacterium sp.]MBV1756198.1 hypothetical protein [Methanobacterium sp.]
MNSRGRFYAVVSQGNCPQHKSDDECGYYNEKTLIGITAIKEVNQAKK